MKYQKQIKKLNQLRVVISVIALLFAGFLFWKIQTAKVAMAPTSAAPSVRIVQPQTK
jgi:hypothetical protein